LLNLYKLEDVPVHTRNDLYAPNAVVYANTHGRILGYDKIDGQLVIPKGAHKVVLGPVKF